MSVPVTVTNTTAKSANADALIKVNGALQIVGSDKQTVSLSANSEARVVFRGCCAACYWRWKSECGSK